MGLGNSLGPRGFSPIPSSVDSASYVQVEHVFNVSVQALLLDQRLLVPVLVLLYNDDYDYYYDDYD